MMLLFWLWLGLMALVALVWLGRLGILTCIRWILPPLHPGLYRDDPADLPKLSVVVAAKDEAANIESCLTSLLSSDYPSLEVIAVDDRSTDGTGAIIDRMAAADPRLKACHVGALPAGWFGKNNAMREGVAHASGDWFCFTDADCFQSSPRSLTVAVRYAIESEASFLSVLPSHEANTFWERVIQPACSGILLLWFNPVVVNNPKRKTAYANGAFMLLRRSCYEAIGGHAAVRGEINEDMHLARRAKQAGERLVVTSNRGLYTVRMYGSLREIWIGWTRIFSGCLASVRSLALAIIVLLLFTFLPWLSLLVSAGAPLTGWSPSPDWSWSWLTWASVIACGLQLGVMLLFYGLNRVGFVYGLMYPLGALLGFGMLLNALRCFSGWGDITWRGTTYRLGANKATGESAIVGFKETLAAGGASDRAHPAAGGGLRGNARVP